MRLPSRRLRPVLAAAALLLAAGPDDRALEAAVRQLHAAVTPRRDGTNLALLVALRQMREPSLRSCFYQLARHQDPEIQLHAVLGLAEIDPSGSIDPWLVRQVRLPEAQRLIVAAAIEARLAGPEQMLALLRDETTDAGARALLAAAIAASGGVPDRAIVAALVEDSDPVIGGVAACTLAHLGDPAALEALRERLSAATVTQQCELLRVLQTCRLTGAAPFVAAIAAEGADPQVQAVAVEVLLALDAALGTRAWEAWLGEAPDRARAVRAAVLLLHSAAGAAPGAWARLPQDDPLLERLAAAGTALARGSGQADALVALMRCPHRSAAGWAMEAATRLEGEQAAIFCRAVLDSLEGPVEGQSERVERGILAAARLFELKAGEIRERLAAAEDDGLEQVAILLGLLDTRAPGAAEAVAPLKRVGFGRADSIATIILAKHAQRLDTEDLRRLGVITAGGGRVSEVLQIQAAWLFLRHTSQIDAALAAAIDIPAP